MCHPGVASEAIYGKGSLVAPKKPFMPSRTYRKPFFLRPWFLWSLGALCLLCAVGLIWASLFLDKYKASAARFDLDQLVEMESASLIYDRSGAVIGRLFIQNREPVPLADLPQDLIDALVAAEDNRFFEHHGIDRIGMIRAALKNYSAGRIRQGASTLTMQLARNTFSLTERSYHRKLVEAYLAMRIEERYSKSEIIEMYLNRVYYGSGFYGAEAASRGYFGKSVRKLSLSECAVLVGLLKSPNNLSPWSNRQACVEQRDFVLGRMLELKMIDQKRHDTALAEELEVKNRRPFHAESYIIDQVRQQVVSELGLEDAPSEGYRIYTSIDSRLQNAAESAIEEELRKVEARPGYEHPTREQWLDTLKKAGGDAGDSTAEAPKYLQGAAIVLDNRNGGILALVGGRDFSESPYNRALAAHRSPGTAFKPLVYAAAFEKGYFPGTSLQDAPIDNRQVMIGGTTGVLGEWGPESDENRYEGAIPARRALAASKNAATVRLGMQVGLEAVNDYAKRSGIDSALRPFPATFLGSSEVTLSEMALAYTTFPGRGWRPEKPYLIERIARNDGKELFKQQSKRMQVTRESVGWEIHSCLSDALERGTGDLAFSKYRLRKLPLGGKTGTAYNFTDVWFLGYDSELTCGVWAGLDRPQTIYRGAFSSQIALPIWVKIMNASFEQYQPKPVLKPPTLREVQICSESGQLAVPACVKFEETPLGPREVKLAYMEVADETQMPAQYCSVHGSGEFLPSHQQGPAASGEWPKAMTAVDLTAVPAIAMQAPTVLGDDPYHSVTPQSFALASGNAAAAHDDGPTVMRAQPVRPLDQSIDKPAVTLDPPPPIKF